jgi:hypothetical protein
MWKPFLLFVLFYNLAVGQQGSKDRSQLLIPPKQLVQIDYPLIKGYTVKLWNKSKFELGVSVRDRKTDSLVKGFGMSKGTSNQLTVTEGNYLQFENRFLAILKVEFRLLKGVPGNKKTVKALTPQRAFYLENNTAQSLPLIIPGVMKPNLNPFSRSGVNLPNGQNIYLNLNGKRILILTVTDSIKQGDRIDLARLINKALNTN